jgi:acyl transferase domain-containing protein
MVVFLAGETRSALARRARALAGDDPGTAARALADAPLAGPERLALLAATPEELADRAERAAAAIESTSKPQLNLSNLAFYGGTESGGAGGGVTVLFPGFGAQDLSLLDALSGRPAVEPALASLAGRDALPPEATTLDRILRADLAAWAFLRTVGLRVDAVAGHSFGENAALIASGLVPNLDALAPVMKVVARASREQRADQLGMIAVTAASRTVVDAAIASAPDRLAVSLDNCPQQLVVWGAGDALAPLAAAIRARGELVFPIDDLTLPVHTPFFPVDAATLTAAFGRVPIDMAAPARRGVAMWSAATARALPSSADEARAVLAASWREPVRFRETVLQLHDAGIRTFIEAGPGGRLTGFVRDTLRGRPFGAVALHAEGQPVERQIQIALATLFARGLEFDRAAAVAATGGAPATDTTPNRRADTAQSAAAVLRSGSGDATAAALTRVLTAIAGVLQLDDPQDIDPSMGLFDVGLTSITAVELAARLEAEFAVALPDTIAFDCPTAVALAARLAETTSGVVSPKTTPDVVSGSEPIAVVGMACRLPGGATSPDAFWQLLLEGRDAITEVPRDRWHPEWFDGYLDPADRARTRHGGFLDDVTGFDPTFFGIAPREAQSMDPQQRLLLELAWEALEDAAIDPASLAGTPAGVFVGISGSDYASRLTPRERLAAAGYLGTGTAASTAAGRLAFTLGLGGPAMAIDTACSSSLVALHLACRSLRRGESTTALVGGVNVIINPETSVFLAAGQALSPTGRCRTFDAAADGYVRAEGGGLLVLKRLADAERDGDRILAIVRGTAMNHSGRTSGLTVPSGPAEADVIRRAWDDAGVERERAGYIEAHGTGTALGDPIEVQALTAVFGATRATPVPIGSVKTNIGHLEAAAGIAGVIKAILQMRAARIAPSLHFHTPNPRIDWSATPFEVITGAREWRSASPRVSGVSSFGISGTNAHAVIEEAPHACGRTSTPQPHILTLSAPTASGVRALAARLADALEKDGAPSLSDVAITLARGRRLFRQRRSVVASNSVDAVTALREVARPSSHIAATPHAAPRVAWLFTGQGAQTVRMGAALEASEPTYRLAFANATALFDACAAKGEPRLADVVHGRAPGASLDDTRWTQPALFAVEYALAQVWRARGLMPYAAAGHSIGEFVAAVVAGVLSLEDAVRLVSARAVLMQSLPAGGGMLAVSVGEDAASALVREAGGALSLAAVNAPSRCVLAGRAGDLERARQIAEARGWRATPLPVSHAFHSALMDPILDQFAAHAATARFAAPSLVVASNVTGRIAADDEFQSARYWTAQLRQPVRFAGCVDALIEAGVTVFVECGPRPVLTALGRDVAGTRPAQFIATLGTAPDAEALAQATAALIDAGVAIDAGGISALAHARRVALPTYPFERTRFWIPAALTDPVRGPIESWQFGRLLGAPSAQPGDSDIRRFEARLSAKTIEEYSGSRMFDHAILPASAFIVMAARLARACGLDGDLEVTRLAISEPLDVPRAGFTVQTVARPAANGAWRARVFSQIPGESWREHATFVVSRAGAGPREPRDEQQAESEAHTTLDASEFYRRSDRLGVEYGHPVRALTALTLGADRASATAQVSGADGVEWRAGAIDAVEQLLGASHFTNAAAPAAVREIERVWLRATPPAGAFTIHTASTDGWHTAGATIRDAAGIALSWEDVRLTALAQPAANQAGEASAADDPAATSRLLRKAAAQILRLPSSADIDGATPLSQLGFDSLMSLQLSTVIQQHLGASVPAALIIDGGSLATIGAEIDRQRNTAASSTSKESAPRFIEGEL